MPTENYCFGSLGIGCVNLCDFPIQNFSKVILLIAASLTAVSGLARFLPFTTKLLLAAAADIEGDSVENQEALAAAAVVVVVDVCSILDPLLT